MVGADCAGFLWGGCVVTPFFVEVDGGRGGLMVTAAEPRTLRSYIRGRRSIVSRVSPMWNEGISRSGAVCLRECLWDVLLQMSVQGAQEQAWELDLLTMVRNKMGLVRWSLAACGACFAAVKLCGLSK
jgi:hypothetical protein